MRTWEQCKRTLFTKDPIFEFAQSGNVEGLKKVVNVLNLDARDEKGYSPLMLAAYHGRLEAVKLLISLKADILSRDKNGNSILMAATFNGHVEVVLFLLENGADPEAANFRKQTAMVFARTLGKKKIERILQKV